MPEADSNPTVGAARSGGREHDGRIEDEDADDTDAWEALAEDRRRQQPEYPAERAADRLLAETG